jgi:peptide/nickel transport system permease protein
MGIADIFLAVPRVILALAMAQALGPSLPNLMLALTVTYWPWFTIIVAAETRSVKKTVFVEATEALGVGSGRMLFGHILPNVLSPIIVRSTLSMGLTIMTAAVLGFLGMGAQPPAPEWGAMIAEARLYLPDAWWYALAPGLAIFVVVMGFNVLGDALRDILDPRLRRGRH